MKLDLALNIDLDEKVNICNDEMTIYEAARWLSLIKGIEVIDKKARQLKIDLEKNNGWVKPLALQKYIEDQTACSVTELKVLLDNEKCTTV